MSLGVLGGFCDSKAAFGLSGTMGSLAGVSGALLWSLGPLGGSCVGTSLLSVL